MNPALERVLRWFFPRRCALCGTVVALDEPLCPDCQKVRPIARPKCLLCGRSKKDCTCKGKHHEYAGVTAPFVYRDSLVTAIHNLKFYDFPMLADYMGDCMAAAVRVDFADVAFDLWLLCPWAGAAAENAVIIKRNCWPAEWQGRCTFPMRICWRRCATIRRNASRTPAVGG